MTCYLRFMACAQILTADTDNNLRREERKEDELEIWEA